MLNKIYIIGHVNLPYPPLPDGTRDAIGVASRKKQLLPVVLGLLKK